MKRAMDAVGMPSEHHNGAAYDPADPMNLIDYTHSGGVTR